MVTKRQESHMRWAIALALEGEGRTSPNPMVGAVVVRGDRVVGEGFHRRAGTPHAEVHALHDAGAKAKGADLYVTLEPCCHSGRTPPCTDAIVRAGIRCVFVGARDPNPRVNGRGMRRLKSAGVKVVAGVLEESCAAINEAYNKFIVSGRPYVTAKAAVSLDGKLATAGGDSRWITNAACRRYVHLLRGKADAVIVGRGTVEADDPRLDVRLADFAGRDPAAVVVDEALAFPFTARLLKRPKGELIAATTHKAKLHRIRNLEALGHRVIVCRATANGLVSLPHMLEKLGEMGIVSVLVEGGGELFADFFRQGLVDRAVVCTAPRFLGGGGKDFLPGLAFRSMKDVAELKDVRIQTFGDNVVIEGDVVTG